MFDKESFKNIYPQAPATRYTTLNAEGVVMNSVPPLGTKGPSRSSKERKCLNRSDTFSELIQLSLKIYF